MEALTFPPEVHGLKKTAGHLHKEKLRYFWLVEKCVPSIYGD
jgi:hypothetical protein